MDKKETLEKLRETVVAEYRAGGVTLRELGLKHGVNFRQIHRWVKRGKISKGNERSALGRAERLLGKGREQMPVEVEKLQKELEEARLYARLLNTMIDIAEEQFEIPIRKKPGAKRS